jgi:hypothetical protein
MPDEVSSRNSTSEVRPSQQNKSLTPVARSYPVNIKKLLAGITKQFPGNVSTFGALRATW